jgi:two-component system, OmpR family, sensor kinase
VTRRRAWAVAAATLALLGALNLLLYGLYRTDVRAVSGALHDRLLALGRTAARWLGATARPEEAGPALAGLADENRLEDAYVFDSGFRIRAGARAAAGGRVNLLRVDAARVEAALTGRVSAARAYEIGGVSVDAAYFPLELAGGERAVLALEAGAEYRAPLRQVHADYLLAVGVSLLLAFGFCTGLWLTLRALERARLAHGRAERLAVAGQLAAMVAHEVRNPLGILRAQIELLGERLAGAGPRERERLDDMLAEVDRLGRLTTEFLDLAREAPLELAPCDLAALVKDTVAQVQTSAPDRRIDVRVEAAPAPAATTVAVDAARIRQVILNLVGNALAVGGPDVAVSVTVARKNGEVRVTVADDGPGVPADLRTQLFEPFVTARPGGSGLGLAIARRIAERHGGRLVLETSPPGAGAGGGQGGGGAAFSLILSAGRGVGS